MTTLQQRFREALPAGLAFCSLRVVDERTETLAVRRGVAQPPHESRDRGAMVTVRVGAGLGYAATPDLTPSGLRTAIERARAWAARAARRPLVDAATLPVAHPRGEWRSHVVRPWESLALGDKLGILHARAAELRADPRIVDWEAMLTAIEVDTLYLTDGGGEVAQAQRIVIPDLAATASDGPVTQRRSLGGMTHAQQGGLEVLDRAGFFTAGPRLAAEALELLAAPDCPTGAMDLLLDADQMYIQIHESIGHPLELDRILGDERNYAGTSFVTPEMFGAYRYGSELLDVTFDPTAPGELAGYGYDDAGTAAERAYVIRAGILERPLGSAASQARAALAGVANARASSWNRPPIDRMANLNVEPRDKTFAELVAGVERGVYFQTNTSWSIDDARNKFQFGCERGQLIENGALTTVVKNPNYRGISATFWRSLVAVGDASTARVLGTPMCGKGEPNQAVRVGHASPACVFTGVDVFGGA